MRENVLEAADADLFVCVQNDTSESEAAWGEWFQQECGARLKSLRWFRLEEYPEWAVHRDKVLVGMPMADLWKDYLKTSGSMVEYLQLYLVDQEMRAHEGLDEKYDYVVRARTDSIFTVPLDFHWLRWSDDDVKARMDRVAGEVADPVAMFMGTLLFQELPELTQVHAMSTPAEAPLPEFNAAALNQYLKTGRYALTLRRNNLYLMRRACFYLLPAALAFGYGLPRSPATDNPDYWFNAECQFRTACHYADLALFDYSTNFEEASLDACTWRHETFFDEGGAPRPGMLYCVVRR